MTLEEEVYLYIDVKLVYALPGSPHLHRRHKLLLEMHAYSASQQAKGRDSSQSIGVI